MIQTKSAYKLQKIANSMFKEIYMHFCGIQDCTPLYSFGPAVREYHLIHICLSGEGDFYANDSQHHIEAGQGFLICPSDLTFYQADKENPWSYAWIAIGGEEVDKYLYLMGVSKKNPVFCCPDVNFVTSCIDDIMKHNTVGYSNEVYIEGILMKFLSYFIAQANVPYIEKSKSVNLYVSKAISYIQKNYQNPITVQEISKYLSLNRSYLTEVFVKTIHFSPQQFLIKFRITKATEFLLNTNLSIENIAYSCGYSNVYAFSKAFKRITGYNPTQYRKEKRIPENAQSCNKDPHSDEKLY